MVCIRKGEKGESKMDNGHTVAIIPKGTEKTVVSPSCATDRLCDLGWNLAVLSLSSLSCEMR